MIFIQFCNFLNFSNFLQTREHFNSSREDIQALMRKMLEVRKSKTMDPGTLNKMFTRSGYLYLMEKKALTTSWNKYYCHYQKEGRLFFMIFYNQANGKMMSTHTTESFRIKTCTRRITDSIEKRFCFDLTPIDRFVLTFLTRRPIYNLMKIAFMAFMKSF